MELQKQKRRVLQQVLQQDCAWHMRSCVVIIMRIGKSLCQKAKVVCNTPAFLLSHICLTKWEPGILIIGQTLVCVPSYCLHPRTG